MAIEVDREAVREVCRFFGGIRSVARLAAVNDANLGKWFNGKPTLSVEGLAHVLDVIGLRDGVPSQDRVHEWELSHSLHFNIYKAFALYFPQGAEVMAAPWSRPFPHNVRRLVKMDMSPEVYAITDGRTRAVLRLAANARLQESNMKETLRWRGGTLNNSFLDIESAERPWTIGPISIREFDTGWGEIVVAGGSAEDLLRAVDEEGISFDEAIRRIRYPL